MNTDIRQASPARESAAGGRCAHLDAEYVTEIRPHLTGCEAQIYEVLVLLCDGGGDEDEHGGAVRAGIVEATALAAITRRHLDTVRRILRRIERLGLIQSAWSPPTPSPFAKRAVHIVRDYAQAKVALRAEREAPAAVHPRGGTSCPP